MMAPEKWNNLHPDPRLNRGVRACLDFFVKRNDPAELRNKEYTFLQFAQLCGRDNPDEDTVNFARYLISSGLLTVSYLFEDDDGSLFDEFSAEEVWSAEREGSLIHPRTGKKLPDYQKRLFPILRLNE
jgi:hypothetical protein